MHRVAAAIVALIAWAAVAIQFKWSFSQTGDLLATAWQLLRFFTILTNLLVAVTFSIIAAGRRVSPFVQGGVALAIILVGVVYGLLLRGLLQLSGIALFADFLLHLVVPVATALYWLVFSPKFGLRWRDPLAWSLYPLAYFGYALLRGSIDGRYPYPFMNLDELGTARTLLNALGIAIGFVIAGTVMVAIGRRVRRVGASQRLG